MRKSRNPSSTPLSVPRSDAGFALPTVIIFALVVGIVGTAFFAMANRENRNAVYREDSSEAFYLADGAIEQARGEFLADNGWRGPIAPTALGNGTYSLVAVDSTWTDGGDAICLYAEGHVRDSERAVEAWVRLVPVGGEQFIVMNDMISDHGNLCLDGHVHVNGDAEFGSNDVNLKCGGTYTEGFPIEPPPAYTEPAYFPNSTYYFVYGDELNKRALIYKYDKVLGYTVDVTASFTPMDSVKVFEYDAGDKRYKYDFTKKVFGDYAWEHYFNNVNGPQFAPDTTAGDSSVVVNFGEFIGYPRLSDIHLSQLPGDDPLEITLINTHFTGASDVERLDSKRWTGGALSFGTEATFAPRTCIALIVHDVDFGNSKVKLGLPGRPALNYVTHDIVKINGQLAVEGTLIVLHDFFNTGGPDITFNNRFLSCLPPDWLQLFDQGSSIMVMLEWKEIPVRS